MELLTTLGIDLKLLVLQIINFGILVFILKKFIYKPVVERIEGDENKLRQADISQQKLDKDRLEFEKYKEEEDRLTQEKAQKIVTEAEDIARGIIEEAHQKAKRDEHRIVLGAKHIKSLQKAETVDAIKEQIYKKSMGDVKNWVQTLVTDKAVYQSLLNWYFERLCENLAETPLHKGKKRLSGNLEYTTALGDSDKQRIQQALKSVPINIKYKKNSSLIVGYRFESQGYRVDANIAYDLAKIWEENRD